MRRAPSAALASLNSMSRNNPSLAWTDSEENLAFHRVPVRSRDTFRSVIAEVRLGIGDFDCLASDSDAPR
jgi:hypothetical protein